MKGTTQALSLNPGDRCIISCCVASNADYLWFWGTVVSIDPPDPGYTGTTCEAVVTGELRWQYNDHGYPSRPVYDGELCRLTSNYAVYSADLATMSLASIFQKDAIRNRNEHANLATRLDEGRKLIQTLTGEATLRQVVASELAKVNK